MGAVGTVVWFTVYAQTDSRDWAPLMRGYPKENRRETSENMQYIFCFEFAGFDQKTLKDFFGVF